jgi:hypothetical protein
MADAVIDDETQYLCGPETLILEQIDEEGPSGSIYKHPDLWDVRRKPPARTKIMGVCVRLFRMLLSIHSSRFNPKPAPTLISGSERMDRIKHNRADNKGSVPLNSSFCL